MVFKSINPYTQEILAEIPVQQDEAIALKLEQATRAFETWKRSSITQRSEGIQRLAQLLRQRKPEYGRLMALEMGKVLGEATGEVEKCAWVCEYYVENGPDFLQPEVIETDARESYVRFDPLGAILGIMPWNFPFWQVFRYAVPALMAGNVVLLKHAPNVPQIADELEKLMLEAGLPEGVFQTLQIYVSDVSDVISADIVRGVTLTGSERAGKAVAGLAGRNLKKTVLELGGSDPFIVLADADLEAAATTAVQSRMLNAGQSCIAAKRWLVVAGVAEEFQEKVKEKIRGLKQGDPLAEGTDIGPMARIDLAESLERQMRMTLDSGAILETGGEVSGCNFQPTLITGLTAEMTAFREETFGPLAAIMTVPDAETAIEIANQSDYGLGASLWTRDLERARLLAARIDSGSVFINGLVRSDPRLPFGGIKHSGYGRELSHYGIHEFVNIKTVHIA